MFLAQFKFKRCTPNPQTSLPFIVYTIPTYLPIFWLSSRSNPSTPSRYVQSISQIFSLRCRLRERLVCGCWGVAADKGAALHSKGIVSHRALPPKAIISTQRGRRRCALSVVQPLEEHRLHVMFYRVLYRESVLFRVVIIISNRGRR